MKYRPTLAMLAAALACASASGQQAPLVPPEALLKRLAGDWPTYSGDYSGQRYSQLSQVTPGNVAQLTLAWAARVNPTVRVPAQEMWRTAADLYKLPDDEPSRLVGATA